MREVRGLAVGGRERELDARERGVRAVRCGNVQRARSGPVRTRRRPCSCVREREHARSRMNGECVVRYACTG